MKTFIIGSSHVTRLKNFIEKGNQWNLSEHEVKVQGVNGGTVSSMFHRLLDVKNFQPTVVFMQIGSNDIGSSSRTVSDVLLSIEILVDVLLSMGVKCVMIGLLMHREKVLAKRGLTLVEYNTRVDEMNSGLYALTCTMYPRMILWIHRGLQLPQIPILRSDGVHLNEEGNRRLRISIRGALLFAESIVQGN